MNSLIGFFFKRPMLLTFVAVTCFCAVAYWTLEFSSLADRVRPGDKGFLFILFFTAWLIFVVIINHIPRVTKKLDKVIAKFTEHS